MDKGLEGLPRGRISSSIATSYMFETSRACRPACTTQVPKVTENSEPGYAESAAGLFSLHIRGYGNHDMPPMRSCRLTGATQLAQRRQVKA